MTCLLFVIIVLGTILRIVGLRLMPFLRYIGEEILLVLGTSSSESALPRLMIKLEQLGCSKPVVGLVVPAGYSFNLDGTAIYMSMAAIFVAQASGVHLSAREQLSILAILLLTSKGAAGVAGSGFVTLAATLSAIPSIPSAALALLLGIDRFMSEVRSITNLIGNAVATVAIAHWDDALDLTSTRVWRGLAGTYSTGDVEHAGLDRARAFDLNEDPVVARLREPIGKRDGRRDAAALCCACGSARGHRDLACAAIGAEPDGCTCANTRRSRFTNTAWPGIPMYSSRSVAGCPLASSTRNVNNVSRFGTSGVASRTQTMRPPFAQCR